MNEIIEVFKRFKPCEDNLKYEHTHLDGEIQRNKISMHIDCCIKSGHLMHYLHQEASCIQVPIPLENKLLYDKIFFRNGLEEYNLLLISTKDFGNGTSKLPYQLAVGLSYCGHPIVKQWYGDEITQEYIEYMSYHDICVKHTPYKTLLQASKFFSISHRAYDENTGVSGCYHRHFFLPCNREKEEQEWGDILKTNPNRIEAWHIEKQLEAIGDRREHHVFRERYSKPCDGLKQVYDFKDPDGVVVMKVIKQLNYEPAGAFKNYVPVTCWHKNGQPISRLLIVPLPDKQIVYNLDKFSTCETVVICPNLEIADQLQRENKLSGVVYTTFLCNEGCFNQVDFSPLKDKSIVILTMNHSSYSLLEVFQKSRTLYDYLCKERKIAEGKLHILIAEVEYHTTQKFFHNITDYLDYYSSHTKPTVYTDSVKLLNDKTAIDNEYAAAVAHEKKLAELNRPYWYKGDEENEVMGHDNHTSDDFQLMRGIIARGKITYINGAKGIGKTNFTSSLVARLLNHSQRPKEFLEKRCWTLCRCAKDKPLKVVYLDYENGEELFKKIKKNFMYEYLPDNREECMRNFIIKHMQNELNCNFHEEAYFEYFCEYLDNIANNEGTKKQDIDVLVIDTYWTFVHNNDTKFEVFTKLTQRYPRMAIIVQHHLNDDPNVYGRKDKTFTAAVIINLTREHKKTKETESDRKNKRSYNLSEPFQVTVKGKLSSFEEDLNTFDVRYNPETKLFEVCDDSLSYEEYIKRLYKHYKTIGETKEDLANDLGISVNTLSNII